MVTSSRRTYTISRASQVCCSQSPCPRAKPLLIRASTGDTQTLKGRSGSVSAENLGPGAHKVLFEPSISDGWGVLIVNGISPLILSGCGFSFWVSYFGGIQHSPIDGCSALGFSFGVLTGEEEHMSFYSATLEQSEDCQVWHQPAFFLHLQKLLWDQLWALVLTTWVTRVTQKDVDQNWAQWLSHNSSKKVKLQLNSYEVLDFLNFHIDCFAHLFLHMPISFWPSIEAHP